MVWFIGWVDGRKLTLGLARAACMCGRTELRTVQRNTVQYSSALVQ